MFIARTVLHSTHAELERRMTARELRVWAAAFQIEPWGEERAAGDVDTLANVLVALQTPKGKRFKPRRWTPDYSRAARPAQSEADMIRVVRRITAMQAAMASGE